MKTLVLLFFLLSMGVLSARADSKIPPIPGEVFRQAGGWQIVLEKDRRLHWDANGLINLQDSNGHQIASVNLKSAGKKITVNEAMGLEVQESDLGGVGSSRTYLKGKKQTKGRKLNPAMVGHGASQSQAKEERRTVDGVAMIIRDFPNGSQTRIFHWLDGTKEEIFLDRRQSLVNSQQTRSLAGLSYHLEQWIEGSFKRRYGNVAGSVEYTFDAGDESYRLVFFNDQAEVVGEVRCRERCEKD